MLSQLKEIIPDNAKKNKNRPDLDEKCEKIFNFLWKGMITTPGRKIDKKFSLEKGDKKYEVHAFGIIEDFSVTLDGKTVFKCAYGDSYYQCNEPLIDMILE